MNEIALALGDVASGLQAIASAVVAAAILRAIFNR